MRVLRVIYVLAIAVALALLVVAGIQAFYPDPSYPDCSELLGPAPDYDSPEYDEWDQECTQLWEEQQQEAAVHDKNVFLIVLPLGVVFAVGGAFLQRRLDIFGAGLILGGIGTMIFAIVPYELDNIPRFIGIVAILAVLIFVGYRVFHSLRRS